MSSTLSDPCDQNNPSQTHIENQRHDQIDMDEELLSKENFQILHPPSPAEASQVGDCKFEPLQKQLSELKDDVNGVPLQEDIIEKLGCWKERGPNGTGIYKWSDGVMFEGEIDSSTTSGKGKFTWPNNATYHGTFLYKCMNGWGVYEGSNGNSYEGNWIMNVKHGFGLQYYANGDAYKGDWYRGKRHGQGTYTWANGNFYTGIWKGDVMSGRGKLTWNNGDSFDGDWANGKEHGYGIYTWLKSGIYVGTWSRGLKDGKGTFFPPGMEPWLVHHYSLEDGEDTHALNLPTKLKHSSLLWQSSNAARKFLPVIRNKLKEVTSSGSSSSSLRKSSSLSKVVSKLTNVDDSMFRGDEEIPMDSKRKATLHIVDREYAQGVLINEIIKAPLLSSRSMRKSEFKRPGGKIIRGHRSYDLMRDLQLGIRYTVGKFSNIQRDLNSHDFENQAHTWMRFPREGSELTPPHQSVNFKWKDYCPLVFGMLREMFKIRAADYLMSICGNDGLRELSSPGKSGSVFFLSNDDRFLIKTLRKQEVKVLLKMLQKYYNHVCKYENTLITKFFGLHCIKLEGGHKVRFVVMGNVFCSQLRIHRRFDLKGSSLGRSANKLEIDEMTILKDLDLDFTIHMEPTWRHSLLKQIEEDCKFLESEQIMDYSLLLGLHIRAPQQKQCTNRRLSHEGHNCTNEEASVYDGTYREDLVLVGRERWEGEGEEDGEGSHSLHIRGGALSLKRLSAAGENDDEEEAVELLAGSARVRIQLGVNMPARACRQLTETGTNAMHSDEHISEVYDVVVCMGIIDILTQYNASKRLEHAYKSIQFDSVSISVVDPHFYSKRFQSFIASAFLEDSAMTS